MTVLGPRPSRVVIVADDLTSATDCGGQMMTGGFRTVIPLSPDGRRESDMDIVALDTDSRNVPPDMAYRLTRQAVAPYVDESRAVFYKSVDSTLRGNLGAELDAILDSSSFDAAILAPAFPTYGRTTAEGVQFLNGRPIHQTEFAGDPVSPVTTSAIARRFAEQSQRKSALVSLAVQRNGAAAVFEAMEAGRIAGEELFIFDASDEQDLERLSGIIGSLPGRFLWVGSTGLSRYVPRAIGLAPSSIRRQASSMTGCVLIVAGSASKTTREQLDACSRMARFTEIRIESRAIAEGEGAARQECERVRQLLRDAVGDAAVIALTLTASRWEIESTKALAAARGLPAGEIGARLSATLGRLTAELLEGGVEIRGLVLTGGATAKATISELRVEAIEILEEVEPGIPLCRLSGCHSLLLVTKAGGFGGPQAIVSAVERIFDHGQD